jgi:hypothetical protein
MFNPSSVVVCASAELLLRISLPIASDGRTLPFVTGRVLLRTASDIDLLGPHRLGDFTD